jgi:ribonucleotide reductase alpha subunit
MRRTLAGEFIMINKYLINEFLELGIWNEKIKNNIIANRGSIQQLTNIPGLTDHIKNKYKTVWEIPMKHLIDMSAERGAFICQSQSLNLWLEEPNYNTLTSMHFYAWSRGLKTGIYYLRRKPKHQAQQFTIEPENHSYDKNKDTVNDDNEFNSYVQGNSHNTSNPSTITNSDDNVCEMCSA